jgi:hypothetical protein
VLGGHFRKTPDRSWHWHKPRSACCTPKKTWKTLVSALPRPGVLTGQRQHLGGLRLHEVPGASLASPGRPQLNALRTLIR